MARGSEPLPPPPAPPSSRARWRRWGAPWWPGRRPRWAAPWWPGRSRRRERGRRRLGGDGAGRRHRRVARDGRLRGLRGAASDAWHASGAADAWAASGASAATGCAASSARSGGAPSAVPSAEFAAATAALRRERPDDGAQAEDQLLEQLHADEEARVTLAAAPDGVAVQEVDAGGRPARWLTPAGRRRRRRCCTSTAAASRSARWAPTSPSPGTSLRRRAGACWPSTTASPPSTRTRPRSTTRRRPTPGCGSRASPRGIALSGESAGAAWPWPCSCACVTRAPRCRSARPCCARGSTSAPTPRGDARAATTARRSCGASRSRWPRGSTPGPRRPTTRRCPPRAPTCGGCRPCLVQPGGAELLRDDAVAFAERARAAGVEVDLDEVPGMWHVFQSAVGEFPEAGAAVARAGAFLRARLRAG